MAKDFHGERNIVLLENPERAKYANTRPLNDQVENAGGRCLTSARDFYAALARV